MGREGASPRVLGIFFQGGGAGGTHIKVRDVGDKPPHGQIPRVFSAQSLQAIYRETDKAASGWDLGLPIAGDIDGGGGV